MQRSEIESKVLLVLSTVLHQDFSSGSGGLSRLTTPGWDSLKHVEIIFALEEELGIEFSEQELAEMDSATKIIAAAEKKSPR